MARRRRGRIGKYLFLMVIAAAAFVLLQQRRHAARPDTSPPPAAGLPDMAVKPKPVSLPFHDCPPEGDGGDPILNRLKNRSDEGSYVPVAHEAILKLPWPKRIERRDRDNWSAADARQVARYEGIPISVEGYLAGAKEEGPESPNCHGEDHEFRDYHIWLVSQPTTDRKKSIVVEVTPRLLEKHPGWNIKRLRAMVKSGEHVRISGWLMLDPEHPDQVGKTRGTIWEIHPIMRIESERGGAWRPIDQQRMLP